MLKTPPQPRSDLIRPPVGLKSCRNKRTTHIDIHAFYRTHLHDRRLCMGHNLARETSVDAYMVIENQLDPLKFTVRVSDGRLYRRHQYHLRERRPDETEQPRPEVQLPPPPVPNRMHSRETVVPRSVASPVRKSTRVVNAPVKLTHIILCRTFFLPA